MAVISVAENIKKTFTQLNQDVDKLAKSLVTLLHLKKGDVVTLWSANCYNWLVIHYACSRAGLILCTLNPVYKTPELEYSLIKSESKVIFLPGLKSSQENVNQFAQIFKTLNHSRLYLKHSVFIDGSVLKIDNIQEHHLDHLLNSNVNDEPTFEIVSSDDPAIIMFTSVING